MVFQRKKVYKLWNIIENIFSEKGLYENEVYKGIREILSSLKQADKKLIVATSKPEKFSTQILKHFDLYDYFDFVAGATMDGR